MFKEIALAVAAVTSVSAVAGTSSDASNSSTQLMCTYKNDVYSIGSKIDVGNDILECFGSKRGKSGSSSIGTAHWE